MNKEEFLRQLELLLEDISAEERADAMAFYRSYFEDAGEGNERAVLEELESPKKVAENIKKNLETGTFAVGAPYSANAGARTGTAQKTAAPQNDNTMAIIVGVLVLVLTSPIWIGVLGAWFGIFVAIIVTMAVLLITGVVLAGVGIGSLVTAHPMVGLGLIGGGFIVLAIGILSLVAVVWLCGRFLPWLMKKIARLWRKLFGRGEECEA